MAQGAIAIIIVFVFANVCIRVVCFQQDLITSKLIIFPHFPPFQRSFIFTRVLYRTYPVIGILGIVRGGIMAWELQYYKDRIVWECQNGGHKWIDPTKPPVPTTVPPKTLPTTLPPAFCNQGVNNLAIVFTGCLVIDFILMVSVEQIFKHNSRLVKQI